MPAPKEIRYQSYAAAKSLFQSRAEYRAAPVRQVCIAIHDVEPVVANPDETQPDQYWRDNRQQSLRAEPPSLPPPVVCVPPEHSGAQCERIRVGKHTRYRQQREFGFSFPVGEASFEEVIAQQERNQRNQNVEGVLLQLNRLLQPKTASNKERSAQCRKRDASSCPHSQ